jgi:hypothetical protein
MDIGSAAGRAHGSAAEQIANLNNYRSDFNFSDLEQLVVEYADGMTRTPVDVSDARFTRLREKFTAAGTRGTQFRDRRGKLPRPLQALRAAGMLVAAGRGSRGGLYEKRSSVRTAGMIRPVGNR